MSELPPLHACITAPELNQHLELLAKQTDTAYIHPKVISFYNDMDRRNLRSDMSEPDNAGRGIYINFWREALGALNRVAFFSTPISGWVGKPKDKWQEWHAWGAAALLNNSQGVGKYLIIYDCDAHNVNSKLRPMALMISSMSNLCREARNGYAIRSVWFGCGCHPAPVGKGLCVEYTMSWIKDIATKLDTPFSGPSDHRVQGFTQITKK